MSIVDIITAPKKYTFNSVDPGLPDTSPVVEVDVTISEEYDFGFEVSKNPVETGIDISDHKRRNPTILRMTGIVTDSPNDLLEVLQGNTSGLIPGSHSRSQEVYERLREIAAKSQPITVVTHLAKFDNMTFTQFTVRKDDAGHYIGFSAALEEIRFATPELGVFEVEIEHTAPNADQALKDPPVLSGSAIKAGADYLDEAIEAAPGGALDTTVRTLNNFVNKGAEVIQGAP